MKELFIPFHIPNFEEVREELLQAIDHDYTVDQKPHAFTYPEKYMMEKCPIFMSWLQPRLKLPVRLYRYYVTPPRSKLPIHIDGSAVTVPFALNIPLSGTKNTYHSYYETSKDNIGFKTGEGYLGAMQPIDQSKLTKIADLEILRPHVTNNSILHGVSNNSEQHRVMFTVRWKIHPTEARTVEECMDILGMFE